MKILGVAIIFIFLSGVTAFPQVCGPSITKITVKDENGVPLGNVAVEFVNENLNRSELKSKWFKYDGVWYEINFFDWKPSGEHRIRLSNESHKPIEVPIYIQEAQRQYFDVVLASKGSDARSSFRPLVPVWGTITNPDGLAMGEVRVEVDGGNSTGQATTSDVDGNYELFLPAGKYLLKFVHRDYKQAELKVDTAEPATGVRRDVQLTVGPHAIYDELYSEPAKVDAGNSRPGTKAENLPVEKNTKRP